MNRYILNDRQVLQKLGLWKWYRSGKVIHWLVNKFKPTSFIELGSDTSYLSELLAVCYPAMKIVAVDKTFRRPEVFTEYDNLAMMQGMSMDVCKTVADKSVGMIYIDCGHEYESVRDDLVHWPAKLLPGGIICGHDYGCRDWPGVKKAVDEFVKAGNLKLNLEDYTNWWISPFS